MVFGGRPPGVEGLAPSNATAFGLLLADRLAERP
jgi:hypothetical protein